MLNRLTRDGFSEIAWKRGSYFGCPHSGRVFATGWGFRPPVPSTMPTEQESQASKLLADAEFGNDGLVALGIVFLEVVEQATALADQHEKAAARAVVFLVRLEVLRQLANAFAEQSDLNFGATGIARMGPVLVNEGFLLLSG